MVRAENNMAKSTKNKKEKTQEDDVFETKSNKKDQNKEVYKSSRRRTHLSFDGNYQNQWR